MRKARDEGQHRTDPAEEKGPAAPHTDEGEGDIQRGEQSKPEKSHFQPGDAVDHGPIPGINRSEYAGCHEGKEESAVGRGQRRARVIDGQ